MHRQGAHRQAPSVHAAAHAYGPLDDVIARARVAWKASNRRIWLNRYDMSCPDPTQAIEITSLEPTDGVVDVILNTHTKL